MNDTVPGWAKFLIAVCGMIIPAAITYGALGARVDAVEQRTVELVTHDKFDALEKRVDDASNRLDRADKRITSIDRNVVRICSKLGAGCVDGGE